MRVEITPRPLSGTIEAVASKSEVHRLLLAAALSDSPSQIQCNSFCDDIQRTIDCLSALGADCQICENRIFIKPIRKTAEEVILDCGESGSTARFLLPLSAGMHRKITLVGSGRLPERPMAPLTHALCACGAKIEGEFLPITIYGGLSGGIFSIDGHISSQFLTGLLFALPLLKEDSKVILRSPLQSKGYVDMTQRVLSQFGIQISVQDAEYHIPGNQTYHSPGNMVAEGDWSSAAFFLASENLGGHVSVNGLATDSMQGDKEIQSILQQMRETKGTLTLDCTHVPDLVPILAVAAAARKGQTVFTGTARLRLKETDRLMTTATLICDLGGNARVIEDTLCIDGHGALLGGTAESHGDHRIAMASAMASQITEQKVSIIGADAVRKSYPTFWEDFKKVGGQYDVI